MLSCTSCSRYCCASGQTAQHRYCAPLPPLVSLFLASSHALLVAAMVNHWTRVSLTDAMRPDLEELHLRSELSGWLPERHLTVRIDTDASLKRLQRCGLCGGCSHRSDN